MKFSIIKCQFEISNLIFEICTKSPSLPGASREGEIPAPVLRRSSIMVRFARTRAFPCEVGEVSFMISETDQCGKILLFPIMAGVVEFVNYPYYNRLYCYLPNLIEGVTMPQSGRKEWGQVHVSDAQWEKEFGERVLAPRPWYYDHPAWREMSFDEKQEFAAAGYTPQAMANYAMLYGGVELIPGWVPELPSGEPVGQINIELPSDLQYQVMRERAFDMGFAESLGANTYKPTPYSGSRGEPI